MIELKDLERVHPEIEKRVRQAQVVEDVMNRKIVCASDSTKPGSVTYLESAGGKGERAPSAVASNKYLPKGKIEDDDDYKRRLNMTPYFPETPKIIQDRIGAIFSERPELDGSLKDKFLEFEESATDNDESLTVAAAASATWMQRVGFQGCFIDRAPLDAETTARMQEGSLSDAEAKARKLGEPYCVFYRPNQILDFETDENGLVWVKVVEFYAERTAWSDEPKAVRKYRIIDRQNVTTYKVDAEQKISKETPIPHGHVDENKKPEVPFVFLSSPVDTWSLLGGSMLIESADADVACTRLLSDIMWALYLLGNPILCWWVHDNEKGSLDLTPGRYVKLKPGTGTREKEELGFAQLDATGLELQINVHAATKAQGRQLAGRVGDAVIQDQPKEVSGVSRAWEFKTGEERVLFLITHALQVGYQKILRVVALMNGLDPEGIKIKFNTKFDIGAPKDKLDISERVFDIASKANMPESAKLALRNIVDSLGPRSEEQDATIEKEIDAADITSILDPNNLDQGAGATATNGKLPITNEKNVSKQGMAATK